MDRFTVERFINFQEKNRAMAFKFGQMAQSTRDSGKMTKPRDSGDLFSLMVMCTRVNGVMIKLMV